MNKLRIAITSCFFLLAVSSCTRDNDGKLPSTISNYNITMSGAQVFPPNASPGTGRIEATFDRKSHILSYKITWANLTGNVNAIHVHGLAPAGYVALPSPLGPYASGLIQSVTSGFTVANNGTYSGSLYIDNVAIKESDLLAGQFYIDLHTTTFPAATTNGEIRGQLTF